MVTEDMDVFLRGSKMRKLIVTVSEPIRDKYELKQIEVDILCFLGSNNNSCLCDVHKKMMLNKGQVSKAMDNLCSRGYIRYTKNSDDRRYNNYVITDEGRPVVEEILDIYTKTKLRLMNGITEEDLDVVQKVVSIVCRNIDDISI